MSLSGLGTALLVPPDNLILLSVAGLAIALRWRRTGLALAAFASLGILVLALPVTADLLIGSLECHQAQAPPTAPPQAIVILSAEANRGVDAAGRTVYAPGLLTLERLRAGAALARRTHLPILVTGGRAPGSTVALASVMADSLAQDFGLTARWVEDRSQDTWENARYSAEMLRRDDIDTIFLVTDAWHMPRAALAFRHFGLQVVESPTLLDGPERLSLDSFAPGSGALHRSYYAFHEWIGRAYYTLRGWAGGRA